MENLDISNESSKLLSDLPSSDISFSDSLEKVVLKWENINFSISENEKSTQILSNISGFANPNQILAIIGGSGSGKTSLLSILSNQLEMQENFQITGPVKLNNKAIGKKDSNLFIRFIPQESVLFEFLTPYEFLKFNMSLRTDQSKESIEKRINKVLKLLQLTKVAHCLIGDKIIRGLSGGEKKRVCIASELILYPSVLILDEPTSGLDSCIAGNVVEILKAVAKFGVVVVMTIHQPSNEMFGMFDRLVLMQEGHFVYQGKAEESVEYFCKLGFEVPKSVNPPEFYMKLLKIDNRNNLTEKEENTIRILREGYQASTSTLWNDMNEIANTHQTLPKSNYTPSSFKSLKFLFWRERLNNLRNPLTLTIKLAQVIVYSILCIMVYHDLGYDSEGIENRRGSIIYLMFALLFLPGFTVSMNLAYERRLTFKDIKADLYGINTYFVVKCIIEIPIMLASVTVLIFSTYYLLDLNNDSFEKPLTLFCIGITQYVVGFALGLFAGSISKTPILANVFGAGIAVDLMTFSGYYSDPESLPTVTAWMRFTTPLYFLRNAALKNEFEDLDYNSDVYPYPKDRYNYRGEIGVNIAYAYIHVVVAYLLAYVVYRYSIKKTRLGKR